MKKELLDITKKSSIVFIGKVISIILGIVFNFIAARYMGPQVYGRFMYVYTFIGFFPLVIKLGLDQGLISFIPRLTEENRFEERNSLISFSFGLILISSGLLAGIVVLNSEFIAEFILNNKELANLVKFLAPLIVFIALIKIYRGIFRSVNKVKYFIQGYRIILPCAKVGVLFGAAFLGYEIYGLVTSFYIGFIISSIYLLKTAISLGLTGKIKIKYWTRYKELLIFSFPLLLSGLLSFFLKKTDTFMIGYMLTEDKVGIYNIALRIGTMSGFVLTAFNTIFAPIISSLYHKGNMQKLSEMYKVITKWVVSINLVVFSLILLFNNQLMRVFGKEFKLGATALILISLGQIIRVAVGSAGYINTMTGYPQYEFYTSFLTVGINISLNYLLVPVYGIEGAAFASFTSLGLTNIIRLLLVYKNHKIHPYSFEYVKVLGVCSVSFFLVWSLKKVVVMNWLIELIGLSVVYLVLASLFYFLFAISENDQFILDRIKSRLLQ